MQIKTRSLIQNCRKKCFRSPFSSNPSWNFLKSACSKNLEEVKSWKIGCRNCSVLPLFAFLQSTLFYRVGQAAVPQTLLAKK